MKTGLRTTAFAFALILSASAALGQVATGTYPYGTFDAPGVDTINVGNLNVHLSLPVLNKAGRGLPFFYNLNFDSSVWYPAPVSGVNTWTPVLGLGLGWSGDTQNATGYLSYSTETGTIYEPPYVNCSYTMYVDWVYHDARGIAHTMGAGTGTSSGSPCPNLGSSGSFSAIDGSGYTLNLTSYTVGTIVAANGQQNALPNINSGAATVTDANGNQISTDGNGHFTDTTGNVVLTVAGAAPNPTTFTYKDTSGNSQTVTMTYATYTVRTNFGCSGITEFGPTSESLVSEISYPDGSTYNFTYETTPGYSGDVTGRIASIEVPQGGTIQYTYSGGSNGIECADGSTSGLTRALSSSAGSASSTWTYTRTTGTGTSQTSVVDGLGNDKTYNFVEAGNQPAGTTAEYYETSRSIYQGSSSGTAVVARNTCYNGATSPCTTTIPTLPFAQIDTYETLDGLETHGTTTTYNTSGSPTEVETYDFGTPPSRGAVLQKELWTYGGFASLPLTDIVYDGSGNTAASSAFNYDGANSSSCGSSVLTTSSGVPMHIAEGSTRGNLTCSTQYASASTSYSVTMNYEDTGSLLTRSTPNETAGVTTLSYDPTFVYQTGNTPPTPSSGVSLPKTAAYDTSYTGLQLSATDPNSQTTNDYYSDPLLRLTKTTYPDGGETTLSYSPTQFGRHVYQSSSVYTDTETQYDGYGRKSRVEISNGQGTNPWYQKDTCYDGNGNAAFTSYSYQGSGFGETKVCSGSGDTSTYDVLGRLTKVVRANGETRTYTYKGRAKESVDENGVTRISQVDGLGRKIIACEISSNSSMPGSGSPVSCGTDIAGTGFITTFAYSNGNNTTTITQGTQTRVFTKDWMGRTTSVQEPESGTTTYNYAYNSTGLLATRQRPKANQTNASVLTTTTTQYDSLGRVVSISYSDGTPTKTFAYDTSTGVSTGSGANFTDLTQANLKGRLSQASVTNAMTAYSYDPVGRKSYLDECLPSGCGTVSYNRQLLYTYDWAGNALTSTDGAGITSAYTLSQANEILSLTSNMSNSNGMNPPDIVSAVKNGPFGPTGYNLGNGLSGAYSYDALGRLDGGWVCSGGSTSPNCAGGTQVYGVTNTWSGTQLQGSSDSVLNQSSTYGYDGFNRLTTFKVGSALNYSYGFDRWGNRWSQTPQNGGSSSSLSFNTATNQISTSGYSYDAAGNMTNDSFNAYTYDAEGNIIQVNSGSTATYVYNARNQRVRATVGSTITEFLFDASGRRVSEWNGSTHTELNGRYYWRGKPIAFYTTASSAVQFEHQDWLGTERMRTTYNGGVEGTFTSLPFGDAQTTASGTDLDSYHFAQLDHDYETETDHAKFRQYSNAQGHWMAPDPYSGSYRLRNPQSFNRYAYVKNNPLARIDPSGFEDAQDASTDPSDLGNSLYDDNSSSDNGPGGNSGPDADNGDDGDNGPPDPEWGLPDLSNPNNSYSSNNSATATLTPQQQAACRQLNIYAKELMIVGGVTTAAGGLMTLGTITAPAGIIVGVAGVSLVVTGGLVDLWAYINCN
ncbi:MAG: RHS repeat-associated core domain-containing protein [Terracidiphilus sp.]|jgi:RHS repeat-associated protein